MNDTKEKHATHTPGPWVVKHDKEGLPFIGVASDPWTYPGTVATVEQEKDARLIAAAPEMLEMCKLFEECMSRHIRAERRKLLMIHASKLFPQALDRIHDHLERVNETIDGKDGYDASYELAKVREVLAKVEGGEG